MGFFDFLTGKKDKFKKQSTLTPEQENKLRDFLNNGGIENNPLYQKGSNFLEELLNGSPEAFSRFEQPLLNQFNQEIAPGIAERFAGMGTGAGATSSSGFQNTLAKAGTELSQNLGAMRSGLQMKAADQALNYSSKPIDQLLQALGLNTNEIVHKQGSKGLLGEGAGGIVAALRSILGF